MSTRNEFLKNFNSILNNFSESISICYASDLENLLGITFCELDKVSNELSVHFVKYFGRNFQYVGVSLSDYFFLPCIILAIWKSGHCFAGIANQYTKQNNLHFLNFLRVKYLVSDSSENDGVLVSQFGINDRRYFIWERPEIKPAGSLEDICYGIMTSGSTGEPKIIQVPWSCILPNAVELSKKFQVTNHDCIFQASPYSFDPFFIELFMMLLSGCSLLIVSDFIKLCPSNLFETLFGVKPNNKLSILNFEQIGECFHVNIQSVERRNVTILQMTPSVFKRWTNTEIKSILSENTPLRILILGGEKFPTDILKLKSHNSVTKIFNIYGITELSCWAFLNEITDNSTKRISIGKPLNDIMYKITKDGELQIGSQSRVCFVDEEKIYRAIKPVFRNTGDVVEVVENEIYHIGRTNQIVKKYGMKINLSKIEFCFSSKNPSIKECFAVFNDENLKLGLFYVPAINEESDISYKLTTVECFKNCYIIPDDLKDIEKPDYFIKITKTPLNLHGKCNKQELLQFLKSIKTIKSELSLSDVFKRLWVEILGVKHNNLFKLSFTELGGNSVLGLKLIAKLEDEGFVVPQDFITILLGKKGYDECAKCLSLESEIPRKRFKFELKTENLSVGWKFDLGKCVDATPTVFTYKGEERIVVGSHSSKLSCLNSNSGCEIWTIFLGDRIESGFKSTKNGSKGFVGCYDHYVYCIDCSNGRIIWKFETDDMVKSTPCLSTDENNVYVGSYDTNLYCLSVVGGQLKTKLKLSNGGIFSSGIISESLNHFFIATLDGTCVAINQETNKPTWKTTLDSPVFASPCLISNQTEILFAEVLGNVHSFNSSTGDKMWTFNTTGNIYSSPIHVEDDIIFGCHDAHVYCVRREKEPKLKWKQHLDSAVFAKPSINGRSSTVCAATTKGFIYLCDFVSGSIITRLRLNGEVFSSPVFSQDRLFVGCRDNYVYAINILPSDN